MTTNQQQYITITAGPSRDELIDAFKYSFSGVDQIAKVEFTGILVTEVNGVRESGRRGKFTAYIRGMEHESGGDTRSFNLRVQTELTPITGRLVRMYYNAKDREGRLDLSQ